MKYNLSGLGELEFEDLCQALALCVLGSGVGVFGDGPDGGREAEFEGVFRYPDPAPEGQWEGYGVLQAKYRRTPTTTQADTAWFKAQVKAELDKWVDPRRSRVKRGRLPEYLIFATNVALSGDPGRGGIASADELIASYAAKGLRLKGWRIWHHAQICRLLDVYPQVRQVYAGFTTTGDVLASMQERRDSDPAEAAVRRDGGSAAPLRVGQGSEALLMVFEAAFAAAGGFARLGAPVSEVTPEGPGFAQRLDVGADGESAVICAVPPGAAVVVSSAVWQAVRCGGGAGYAGVNEIGLPVPGRRHAAVPYVDGLADVVELGGGSWGPGSLVRTGSEQTWSWQPDARVGFETAEQRRWLQMNGADLRVRAVAVFSWMLAEAQLEIVKAGRDRLAAAVATCELANAASVLSLRRGGRVAAAGWERATGVDSYQSDRSTHLRSVVRADDGSPALSTDVIAQVAHGLELPNVRTCAELRISFPAWRSVLGKDPGRLDSWDARLPVAEVAEVLVAAWNGATLVAPLAVVDDPRTVPLLAAPYVEFHLQAVQRPGASSSRVLTDVVDLSPFGEPAQEGTRQEGGMRIVAPLGLDRTQRSALICQGLARLARSSSYVDADQDQLLTLMWDT